MVLSNVQIKALQEKKSKDKARSMTVKPFVKVSRWGSPSGPVAEISCSMEAQVRSLLEN